jgi:phosphoribosylformimino-5-aminoimidazole carboxamide ribotide isomerase
MRVIPVIDLMNDQVVHAVAGQRSEYRPIKSLIAVDSRPRTVAQAFVQRFGFDTVYVADLDAILGDRPNVSTWDEIHRAGLKLLLDAGTGTPQAYADVSNRLEERKIDATLVIPLERLRDPFDDLWWNDDPGMQRPTIFSLDLINGVPSHQIAEWRHLSALEIVAAEYDLCCRDFLVLDLADVGTNGGTRTLELCKQIRQSFELRQLIAGGGVRNLADLKALAAAGCNAALVASALHDGRLTPADLSQLTTDN